LGKKIVWKRKKKVSALKGKLGENSSESEFETIMGIPWRNGGKCLYTKCYFYCRRFMGRGIQGEASRLFWDGGTGEFLSMSFEKKRKREGGGKKLGRGEDLEEK